MKTMICEYDMYSTFDRVGEGVMAQVEIEIDETKSTLEEAVSLKSVYFKKEDADYIDSFGGSKKKWVKAVLDIFQDNPEELAEAFFYENDENYNKLPSHLQLDDRR